MWSDIISGAKAIGGWVQLSRDNRRLRQQNRRDELIEALSELHRTANFTRAFAADATVTTTSESGKCSESSTNGVSPRCGSSGRGAREPRTALVPERKPRAG